MHFRKLKMASLLVAVLLLTAGHLAAQTSQSNQSTQARVSVDERSRQWDRNGDGKRTQDEVPGERLFKTLDQDGDGVVTKDEANAARTRAGRIAATTTVALPPAENFKPREHGDEARAAGLKADVLAKIDVEMQRHVAAPDVAGIIALVSRHGKIGYFETFGFQDIEAQKPLPKDAIFRLQSMSKPVVAACAMSLYDEGKFTLDEPISKHCPEWAEPKVLEDGQFVPAKFAITPRMLMSHSSGLYYGSIENGARTKDGNQGKKRAFDAMEASLAGAKNLKEYSESLAKQSLKFQPGTAYQYGHSIDVLGRYIEAVTGKPLDEVIQERILGPLKMTSTDFWVHPENVGRICQIYKQPRPSVLERGRDAGKLTGKPTLFMGGQGLCSSTEDYERFCRMMLGRGEIDGVRVLKAETVDLMFQNHLKPELGQKYGLGGAVDGEGSYTWGGANGTQFWIDRRNNLFAIFMVQTQRYRSPAFNEFKRLATTAVTEAK
jgi:CubicO group peptidase (beta-lactamase class C family)